MFTLSLSVMNNAQNFADLSIQGSLIHWTQSALSWTCLINANGRFVPESHGFVIIRSVYFCHPVLFLHWHGRFYKGLSRHDKHCSLYAVYIIWVVIAAGCGLENISWLSEGKMQLEKLFIYQTGKMPSIFLHLSHYFSQFVAAYALPIFSDDCNFLNLKNTNLKMI